MYLTGKHNCVGKSGHRCTRGYPNQPVDRGGTGNSIGVGDGGAGKNVEIARRSKGYACGPSEDPSLSPPPHPAMKHTGRSSIRHTARIFLIYVASSLGSCPTVTIKLPLS